MSSGWSLSFPHKPICGNEEGTVHKTMIFLVLLFFLIEYKGELEQNSNGISLPICQVFHSNQYKEKKN